MAIFIFTVSRGIDGQGRSLQSPGERDIRTAWRLSSLSIRLIRSHWDGLSDLSQVEWFCKKKKIDERQPMQTVAKNITETC